jgi:chemotaxis protein MotB
VDIVVLSQAPAETKALMAEAYADLRRDAGLDEPPAPDDAATADTDHHPSAASRRGVPDQESTP